MEVIPLIRSSATGSEASNGDNGIKRRVQEWSRLDRLTGILEHARVEADQWTNHTANTKHKYGKVRTTRVIPIKRETACIPKKKKNFCDKKRTLIIPVFFLKFISNHIFVFDNKI